MSVSIKFDKHGIEKIERKIENEIRRQIQIGVHDLRKDSEKFLAIILKKRDKTGENTISCDLEDFSEIPNIQMNVRDILDDLKIHGCIGYNSLVCVTGEIEIYLTMEGMEYFNNRDDLNQGVQMNNNTNNFYGSVSNIQIQQGTVNSTQIQTVTTTSETVNFEKVAEFVEKIKKYDAYFDDEYGEHAIEVREKIDELSTLVQNKDNPGKIKSLLMELKNLSVGVTGSLIATGIVEGIKLLFM